MGKKMWFGTAQFAQWVPCPSTGMKRDLVGFSDEINFENAGVWIEESAGFHAEYSMDFPVSDASDYNGIEAFNRFAAREHGDGYLRFVDPMQSDQNILNPSWASPGLLREGWKNIISPTDPSFVDSFPTTPSVYGKPRYSSLFNITTPINTPPATGYAFTFLIPPGYTLRVGASGVATGTAVLQLKGNVSAAQNVTLSATTAIPAFTNSLVGNTNSSATLYVTRTSVVASTITLNSIWAQILPDTQPASITRHIPGKGSMGLRFRGKAIAETYVMVDRHMTGMSAELVEVEPSGLGEYV